MKAQFKNPIKIFAPFFLMLMAMFFLGFGCNTSKPAPDPLAGWKIDFAPKLDQAIENDCQDYMQKLPPEEKKSASWGKNFEDGTGQHAVVIEVALNGTWWNHILIYDKDNNELK